VSELLDRIVAEIRERLSATRAAALEHQRLEAALSALEDVGARATRAVSRRSAGQAGSAKSPSEAAARSSAATGKRAARTSAPRSNKPRAASAATRGPQATRGHDRRQVTPAHRAPRGANREAVLRAVNERPDVSARELAAVSGVHGGTLYALLRTLVERGELEKLTLPGGQTGYRPAAPRIASSASTSERARSDSASAATEPTGPDEQQPSGADPASTESPGSAGTDDSAPAAEVPAGADQAPTTAPET
jgi:hypothetical protein